jgi:hypothetical protein
MSARRTACHVAAYKAKCRETEDALRLIVEAQAAREELFWQQWEADFLRDVPHG